MSSDWIREHKVANTTEGGALMEGVCVAFRAKERGVDSFMLLGVLQCLLTGFVSTKRQLRPREVRRWRGVCVAFRSTERGVVSLI